MRILVMQGHPSPDLDHFDEAVAAAYGRGALEGGHELRVLRVAALDFPLLRSMRTGTTASRCRTSAAPRRTSAGLNSS